MRVKICGITRPEQGTAIARLGATALGFICVPSSPRYISPQQIQTITTQLPSLSLTGHPLDRIGVFVNATLEEICHSVAIAGLNGVQLHGTESPEFCTQVRAALPEVELIKAFRVRSRDDLSQLSAYSGVIDTLLLDAYHPNLLGGTGTTLDWQSLKAFCPECPWFLAGGLTPENILEALGQVHPDGIDLSSGVEKSPGDKDLDRVADLFQQLQVKSA